MEYFKKNISHEDIYEISTLPWQVYEYFEDKSKVSTKGSNKENSQMSETTKKLIKNAKNQLNDKKQIILYGPAGTGKTYNTKSIIEKHSKEDYETIKQNGRVKFVTFHQSFAYEDFIEGIKPDTDGGNVTYDVQDGVFKEFCNSAKQSSFYKGQVLKASRAEYKIYKVTDEQLFIAGKNKFILSKHMIDEFVEYIIKNNIDEEKFYANKETTEEFFNKDIDGYQIGSFAGAYTAAVKYKFKQQEVHKKNHYLIIDEINRGNISKIFGELITLLESSKRLGSDDKLTTTLPYSKEEFGIPPNLYIISTMNTSDKSIAHLDIALRRRFGFVEMLPNYDKTIIENKACRELLGKLNNRIEILLDKDHLIGHSFFCDVEKEFGNKEDETSKISNIMQYEIVPLLEEYFYGDFEKIQLVLDVTEFKLNEDKSKTIPEELQSFTSKDKFYKYWFESDSSLVDEKENESTDTNTESED